MMNNESIGWEIVMIHADVIKTHAKSGKGETDFARHTILNSIEVRIKEMQNEVKALRSSLN